MTRFQDTPKNLTISKKIEQKIRNGINSIISWFSSIGKKIAGIFR
jgi:hypothetical protein